MPDPSEVSAGFGAWDEWHYRHEFFWAAATRWLVAVLAVAALPYSSEPLRRSFGWLVIVFPVFACLLGAVAFGHLLAEHARALYVRWHVGYRERENDFLSDTNAIGTSRAHVWLRQPITWRIGPYIFSALAIGLLGLTGVNLLVSRPFLEKALLGKLPVGWSVAIDALGYAWLVLGIGTAVALIIADRIRPSRQATPPPTA